MFKLSKFELCLEIQVQILFKLSRNFLIQKVGLIFEGNVPFSFKLMLDFWNLKSEILFFFCRNHTFRNKTKFFAEKCVYNQSLYSKMVISDKNNFRYIQKFIKKDENGDFWSKMNNFLSIRDITCLFWYFWKILTVTMITCSILIFSTNCKLQRYVVWIRSLTLQS